MITVPLSEKVTYKDCYHCGKSNSLHININKKLGVVLGFECDYCGKTYPCNWVARGLKNPVPLYNINSIIKSTLYKNK